MNTERNGRPQTDPEWMDVAVPGGILRVARWGGPPTAGQPVVIAAHGITSSHRFWSLVADRVAGDTTLLAPDLRGRGDSNEVGPPYGIHRHADDLIAVLDAAGVERALLAGHSMGGFVVAAAAARHPQRVERVVLVDGGPPLTADLPPDADVEAILAGIIGPSLERLRRRFSSREEYRAFWRAHPAFEAVAPEMVDAYADHDLTGDEADFRSKVVQDAVLADAADILGNDDVRGAATRLQCQVTLLYAERGMLDEPAALYDPRALEQLARPGFDIRLAAGTNHFTIGLSAAGADAIAQALRQALLS